MSVIDSECLIVVWRKLSNLSAIPWREKVN